MATQQASRVPLPGMCAHTKEKGPSEASEARPGLDEDRGRMSRSWPAPDKEKGPSAGHCHPGTLSWSLTPLGQKQAALLSRPPLPLLTGVQGGVMGTAPTAFVLTCHQDSQPRQEAPPARAGTPGAASILTRGWVPLGSQRRCDGLV